MTSKVAEPKTREEFDALLSGTKGAVVVDFTSEGCGACDPKVLAKLAEDCETTTVVRVDLSGAPDDWQNALADKFDVQGTPTTLLAERASQFAPGKVEEIDPTDAATRKRIKCAR
jgi:hypothetical protein